MEWNGFIPTCVGNTYMALSQCYNKSVHPHVRGEYVAGPLQAHRGRRFIPTCVGNTPNLIPLLPQITVHPHVRGEYIFSKITSTTYSGSSPRAWGILPPHHTYLFQTRFIPTCVGNTFIILYTLHHYTVHPHVRGEYVLSVTKMAAGNGSSPRAWGIRYLAP